MEITVVKDLKYQDSFKGTITKPNSNIQLKGTFKILSNNPAEQRMSIKTKDGVVMTIPYKDISTVENVGQKGSSKTKMSGQQQENKDQKGQQHIKKKEALALQEALKDDLEPSMTDNYEEELLSLINAGVKNIWLVGPAGCGKTTITRNVATKKEIGLHVITCGLGTSSSEFTGYKYPNRETTPFAEYYAMPSVILLDEFTALDPAVAQICNSALANGFIMTTTGKVERHPDCVIVATSNTFGQGASRQYVSNNQLDASTIDRFVGGIMEMDYSPTYESTFDQEVYGFIQRVRTAITGNTLRRIASTRMLIEGCKLKLAKIMNWKYRLVANWTKAELEILRNGSSGGFKAITA